jgi:acetaldehyde dehydrogenase
MKVSIIGTGQIGFDLLHKLLKLEFIEIVAFVGKRETTKNLPPNVIYSSKSIEYFISNPNCCDVVFDCTDAYSAKENYKVFSEQCIKVIDLTPSNIGEYYVPNICSPNVENINMVTCGGQVSIPILNYFYNRSFNIEYAEIVTQISSESAGMATRINIDKYIETTENAINKLVGINNCKVILNINPCKDTTMQTTIYLKTKSCNYDDFDDFINEIKMYVPNYNAKKPIWLTNEILMVHLNIIGNGDYISKYSGNLDIINCAAVSALISIYKNQNKLENK